MPKIDAAFYTPFVDGTIETLKVQCSLATRAGKPYVKGKGQELVSDISAIAKLSSRAFNGAVAVCFPERVFLSAMEGMLGEKCTAITKELEDGAGELLNIILGHSKKILNAKGHQIEKALPKVLRGADQSQLSKFGSETVIIPFETSVGHFQVELTTGEDDG